MNRSVFLLCLLCMGQVMAAPSFPAPQGELASDTASATPSASPSLSPTQTASAPSASPTPIPGSSASDAEGGNKGLKEGGGTLLGITVFLIFLIVLGVAYSYKYPAEPGEEEVAPPDRWTRFFDSLGLWHRALFDFTKACMPEGVLSAGGYIGAPLSSVLAMAGVIAASGTTLGVGVLFFFVFAAVVSDPERCNKLEFEKSTLQMFVTCIFINFLFFSIFALAMRIDDDKKDIAALVLLMVLSFFLVVKASYALVFVKKHDEYTEI